MGTSKLKVMQVIHTGFCSGIACFAAVALIIRKERTHFSFLIEKNDPYFPLFPVLAVIFVTAGFYLFRKRLNSIDPAASGDEKIAGYQTAFIIRCAFLEAPALLNLVAFLISGNLVYLIAAAAVMAIFIFTRPQKEHVIEWAGLQFPDTEKL